MALRNWKCPRCERGVRAPVRPRKDDVRRYCLPCSQSTGRLVERVCPTNERERELKQHRRKERASRQARREAEQRRVRKEKRASQYTVSVYGPGGRRELDLAAQARRWSQLPAFGGRQSRLPHVLELDIRSVPSRPFTTGRAWSGGNVFLSVGTDEAHALRTLLHELAHIATPGHYHDRVFKQTFITAARQAFQGIEIGRGTKRPMRVISEDISAGIQAWLARRYALVSHPARTGTSA